MPEAEWNAYDHYHDVGMERGLEQGREEGARRVLMRLLQLRFGGVGPEDRRRVEAIHSVDALEKMGERVLDAKSLQEVLSPG